MGAGREPSGWVESSSPSEVWLVAARSGVWGKRYRSLRSPWRAERCGRPAPCSERRGPRRERRSAPPTPLIRDSRAEPASTGRRRAAGARRDQRGRLRLAVRRTSATRAGVSSIHRGRCPPGGGTACRGAWRCVDSSCSTAGSRVRRQSVSATRMTTRPGRSGSTCRNTYDLVTIAGRSPTQDRRWKGSGRRGRGSPLRR